MVVLVMFASMTRTADAQLAQGILDFLTTFDFDSFFASICPILEGFDVSVSFCGGGTDDDGTGDDGSAGDDSTGDDGPAPVAAPTKKGKVVAVTAAPVAPSATP